MRFSSYLEEKKTSPVGALHYTPNRSCVAHGQWHIGRREGCGKRHIDIHILVGGMMFGLAEL